MKNRFTVLLLLLMSLSCGAMAEDGSEDGSSLLGDCGAAVKALDNGGYAKSDSLGRIGFCYGYVMGV